MIYTGGVSIKEKEILYVSDALIHGWDGNHDKYIKQFEADFATYVGVSYAKTTSGGTQALMLALATLEVGPGDEVILPDLTYFACSDVIVQLGAKPVFVDVDMDTWCISPEAIEKAITPKTKAIMPVWMYGGAPKMDRILKIANYRGINIVEDACPAVGSIYLGLHAGSFAEFGCFSFHGAKIMTTGFGGMAVTDDKGLYERMCLLADHGEDKSRPYRFWQIEQGYSFDMTNVSAAMGVAQLERIEEFVEKKRLIYKWYTDRLQGIDGITFNPNIPFSRDNKWLTSIVLDDMWLDRDTVMKKLKEKGIDTRPFFFPISDFPMYDNVNTPNAHYLGYNGINLPSGVQRTEEDIDFICNTLKEILGVNSF
jgi:perosamine synthetase